jgi:hypothetical protein
MVALACAGMARDVARFRRRTDRTLCRERGGGGEGGAMEIKATEREEAARVAWRAIARNSFSEATLQLEEGWV